MENIKLNFADKVNSYVQSPQTSSIKFSPVYISNDEYYQGWYNVKCRDKMNDLPAIIHLGANIPPINGFWFYEPELFENYGDTLMISVSFGNYRDELSFKEKFKLFTDFEERYGLIKSEIFSTQKERTFLIKSDMFWCQSVLTISLYTFLLRTLSYGEISKSKFGKEYDATVNTKLEELLSVLCKYYNYYRDEFFGIDGLASKLLIETLTDLDTLMRYIPYLLIDNPISGLNDKELMDYIINKDKEDSQRLQSVTFKYENSKMLPISAKVNWCRSTIHCDSGFYSLLKHVLYNLKSLKLGGRLSYVPDWVVKYIELLYIENKLSDSSFIGANFKLGDT